MSPVTPERRELLALARASIESTLSHGRATLELAPFTPAQLPPALTVRRSSFVTLRRGEELRGCCGSLDGARRLAEDVWRNAWAAAFNDYRFKPLTAAEWPHMNVHLSLLTVPERLDIAAEEQLLATLRPSIDGLILESDTGRATSLPDVWEQIPDPLQFVRQLKMKAGWPATFWSSRVRCWRYTTESFGED
jgi:AmmeMemoRadiSam system protein A